MARLHEMLGHDLPGLVLTGDISTATLSEISRHGYLHRSKPISAKDLTQLVQTLLAGPRPAVPPAGDEPPPASDGTRPPTIFVVDDDAAVRDTLGAMIEQAGRTVEVYEGAQEFLDAHPSGGNGCLIVDCRMPGMNGIELLERLKQAEHPLPTIMITGFGDVPLAVRAMKAGAAGFIEKPVRGDELLVAIDRAMEQAHGSEEVARLREAAAARIAALTPRQRRVMDLVIEGKPNKEIAFLLGISQRTIENHRAAVMKAIGARSLSQLIHLTLGITS